MITFIFRKRSSAFFSIEQIFQTLYTRLQESGTSLAQLELPHISTGIGPVLKNIWFVARHRATRHRATKILHITGDVHYAALLCPFARTVITIHDCGLLKRGTGFKRLVMWILWFGLPLRLAAAVVVISEQTKREVLETVRVPARKIRVIPNFIDPAFVFSEYRFASARPRILHVGTTPNKNLSRVVNALRDIPCVLVIVGVIPDPVLRQLTIAGTTFENHISVDKVAMVELYRQIDLVSFPSTYEGFGMPILEGQAAGRPVLTSDLDPMRSVAGPDGALLVDPHSEDTIRAGFSVLISDNLLRARLIAAGRENCRRFALDAIATRYRALYRELEADSEPGRGESM